MPTASTALTAVTIAVVVTASAALAAGPASSAARAYTARLDGPDAPENAPRVRRPRLLDRRPQATAVLILTIPAGWWGARAGALADTVTALPLVAILVVACSVDAVCHRLPNRLLGAAAAWLGAALIGRAVAALVAGATASRAGAPPARAALCALGLGGAALILALLPSGLGMGDVKLCALTGLWLGPLGRDVALGGALAGVVLAGLSALVLMAARVVGRRQMIAMGPHLIAGAWLAWILAVRAGA